MPRTTFLFYSATKTDRDICAVMELGMMVATAHHTHGLPWDMIALELGWWYPLGLTEDDLAEFGNEHRTMAERNVLPQAAIAALKPLYAEVRRKVAMVEEIAKWWATA